MVLSYLSLQEAYNLGRTCRRMFGFYEESTQSRKRLLLIDGNPIFLNYMTTNFFSASPSTSTNTTSSTGQNQQHQNVTEPTLTSRFPLDTLRLPKREPVFGKAALPLYRPLFTSILPNLTYLEVVSGLPNGHLSTLVRALNELRLLETLKLYLNGCQEEDEAFDRRLADNPISAAEALLLPQTDSSSVEAQRDALRRLLSTVSSELRTPHSPVYSLSLPALKHLTLSLRAMCLFYRSLHIAAGSGRQVTATQRRYELKARPNTFRLLCPRLATLQLNSADCLRSIIGLIRKAVLPNSTLISSAGNSVQVVLHLGKSDLSSLPGATLDKVALEYITHLKVSQELPPAISNFLPLLRNLREVSLTIGSAHLLDTPSIIDNDYYTSVLDSLASLAHLSSVQLYFCNSQTTPLPLVPKPLAVLPTVTSLSIDYSTINHSDVVEQLRLAHCFPNLQSFVCTFNQSYCRHCCYGLSNGGPFVAVLGRNYSLQDVQEEGYRMGAEPMPHRLATKLVGCAGQLVRGLEKLEGVLPEKRAISFFFRGKETNLSYDKEDNSWSIV